MNCVLRLASTSRSLRSRRRRRGSEELLEPLFHAGQRVLRALIVLRLHRLARFLHLFTETGERLPCAAGARWWKRGDLAARLHHQRRDLRERTFRVAAEAGARVRRSARRVLCLLAAGECVIEREAIVALGDGLVGLVERGACGRVLVGGVAFGAGRAGGIDRTLGLIHFLVWRRSTRGGKKRGEQPRGHHDLVAATPAAHEG